MRTVSHAPPERHYNTFDLVQLADSIAHETPYDGTGPVKAPSRLDLAGNPQVGLKGSDGRVLPGVGELVRQLDECRLGEDWW